MMNSLMSCYLMTEQHPLTDELIKSWIHAANHNEPMFPQVACSAADWQLEQVLEWSYRYLYPDQVNSLREAMRPQSDDS